MMRIASYILTAIILFTPVPAFALDWKKYHDHERRFSVSLPGKPTIEDTTIVSRRSDTYPQRIYRANDGESRYRVKVADYTPPPPHLSEAEAVEDVRSAVAWEAWQYRRDAWDTGGEITSDGYAQLDGVEGHRLRVINADQSQTFVTIFLFRRRLYVLEATVPEHTPGPMQFQSSFQMLNPNGKRVRFEIDVNGQRTVQTQSTLH